jgi:hypothetical protein
VASSRWLWNDVFRIAFLVIMLVAVVVLRDDCATGISRFMGTFEAPADAGPPAEVPPPPVPEGWELVPADQVDLEKMFPSGDAGAPAVTPDGGG